MPNVLTVLSVLLCLTMTNALGSTSEAGDECFDAEKVASINKMGSGSGPGIFESLSLEVDCESKALNLAVTTKVDPLQHHSDALDTISQTLQSYMCGEAGFAPAFAKGWTARMTIQFQGRDLTDPISISDC